MDDKNKNIDETWKETPDFNFFITTLALQASISLGQVPNPATNQKEENLPQAKFIIDTLAMLKEKTKGNLTSEENKFLEDLLYELRMQYVFKTKSNKVLSQEGDKND